jgi:hypothetical protein
MKPREDALLQCEYLSNEKDKEIMRFVVHEIYNSFEAVQTQNEDSSKDPWAWVKTEYVALFKERNHERGGYVKESIIRMKKMFAAMPEIRKEDVIAVTRLYLSKSDSRYIRFPHYFLKKGMGETAVYEFLNWYEIYQETKEAGSGRASKTNSMQ